MDDSLGDTRSQISDTTAMDLNTPMKDERAPPYYVIVEDISPMRAPARDYGALANQLTQALNIEMAQVSEPVVDTTSGANTQPPAPTEKENIAPAPSRLGTPQVTVHKGNAMEIRDA